MTVKEVAERLGCSLLAGEESYGREVESVYCCDLLSFVMGRAPADSAWVTVMGNVNAMAVSMLADTACIVLAEGAALDAQAKEKADQNGIAVLGSKQPVYEAARAIDQLIRG